MTTYFFAKTTNNILNPRYIFIPRTNYYSKLFTENIYIIDNHKYSFLISSHLFPENSFHKPIVVTKKTTNHKVTNKKLIILFALLPTFIMGVEYKSGTVKLEKLFLLVS